MTKARSYINLINEFWADFDNRGLSSQAVMLYFYIINRINRNRWQPVTISDRKLSQALSVGRKGLGSYRRQLTDNGLLTCTDNAAEGRTYGLPVEVPDNEPLRPVAVASVDAGGGVERSHLQSEVVASIDAGGGVEKSHFQSEVAPVEAGGGFEWSHFEPKTPYYIEKTNKTCIDLKTSKTEPSPNAELARAGNVYLNRRQRAAEQAELTVQAFFAECNRPNLDVLCMQNGLDHVALQGVARRIADDWIQDGRCHDSGGEFDLGDAVRHMRNTIPKKIAAERRAGDPSRMSREEHRLRLMQTVTERVNDMLAGRVVDEPEPASPF